MCSVQSQLRFSEQSSRRSLVTPRLRYGLTHNTTKTHHVEFPPPCGAGGHEPPASFDLLGFTHIRGRSRRDYWVVRQITSKRHRHAPLADQQERLTSMKRGHCNDRQRQGTRAVPLRSSVHLAEVAFAAQLQASREPGAHAGGVQPVSPAACCGCAFDLRIQSVAAIRGMWSSNRKPRIIRDLSGSNSTLLGGSREGLQAFQATEGVGVGPPVYEARMYVPKWSGVVHGLAFRFRIHSCIDARSRDVGVHQPAPDRDHVHTGL